MPSSHSSRRSSDAKPKASVKVTKSQMYFKVDNLRLVFDATVGVHQQLGLTVPINPSIPAKEPHEVKQKSRSHSRSNSHNEITLDIDNVDEVVEKAVENAFEDHQTIVEHKVEEKVEEAVETLVEQAVEDAIEDKVEHVVEEAVHTAVEEAVEDAVEEAVADKIADIAEDKIEDAVEEKVEELVKEKVEEEVKEIVQEIVKEEIKEAIEDMHTNLQIRVKDLPRMDVIGKCDPFYKLKLDGTEILNGRDQAVENNNEAEWNVSLQNLKNHTILNIEIYDKDTSSSNDDYIGQAHILVAKLLEHNHINVDLEGEKAKDGKMSVHII